MASKTEAKIKFEADAAPFTQAISQASRTLTELRSALKLNAAQLAANGNNVEGLARKQELLAQKAQALADKKAALTEKLRLAEEQLGANSATATNLRTTLNYLEVESAKLQAEMADTRTAYEKLSDTISGQESKLKDLKTAYANAVLEFGEGSREADDLAGELKSLSSELEDNRTSLNAAKTAANNAAGEMADLGDSMADAESDALSLSDVITGDLISDGLQALGDTLVDAAESTREYRTIMASLEVSSQRAGYSAADTASTYRTLYGVLADDQSAATTTANLQAMGLAQSELQQMLLGTIGAWASYGDSIPIDGLAEAINETVQSGTVTGAFADVLNWAGASEDEFNAKLAAANSTTERAQIVLDELARQGLTDAGEAWQANNQSLVEANQATADQQAALAQLGEQAEPVLTAVTNGFAGFLTAIANVTAALDTAGIADAIDAAFGFLLDNGETLLAIIAGIAAGFAAWQIASIIQTAGAALTGLTTAITAAGGAMAFLNAMMAANPFGLIAIAIGAVVAAGVLLYQNWDTVCQWAGQLRDTIAGVFQGIGETVSGIWTAITQAASAAWTTIQSVVQVALLFVAELISGAVQIITLPWQFIWENCKGILTEAWSAIQGAIGAALAAVQNAISTSWNAVKSVTSGAFNSVRSVVSSIWNGIRTAISGVLNGIRTTVSNAWNTVKSATSSAFNAVRSTVSSIWSGIRSTVGSVVGGIVSTVSSKFNSIKNTISSVLNGAKNIVSSAINAIKSKFNFSWSLPKLKLPHLSITGKFSITPPSVPRFSIRWYREGGILDSPTIFGRMGSTLLGGGEAGPEAVAPIDVLQEYVAQAVEQAMDASLRHLASSIDAMSRRPIVLQINGRRFAAATAGDTDDALGTRQALLERGLCL